MGLGGLIKKYNPVSLAYKGVKKAGKELGIIPPSASEMAQQQVLTAKELQPLLYRYRPEAFQLGAISQQPAQEARQQMASFGETLRRRAEGQAPSLAELQLQAGQQRQQQSLQAALAGLRGRQAGLGIRGLQQQFAEQGQSLSQQAAQMRAAEQASAEQQLAKFLSERAQLETGAQELSFREQLARQQIAAELEKLRGADILSLLGAAGSNVAASRAAQQQLLGSLIGAGAAFGAAKVGQKS